MRRKKMRRRICPVLRTIWDNVATIVSPLSNIKRSPISCHPTVDWQAVNKRFLSNIPSPTQCPILSCSEDEAVYNDKTYFEAGGTRQVVKATFGKPNPFGTIPGYQTNHGVIPVPQDNLFHGYTWVEKEGWVLLSKFPSQKKPMRRRRIMKKNTKKKK